MRDSHFEKAKADHIYWQKCLLGIQLDKSLGWARWIVGSKNCFFSRKVVSRAKAGLSLVACTERWLVKGDKLEGYRLKVVNRMHPSDAWSWKAVSFPKPLALESEWGREWIDAKLDGQGSQWRLSFEIGWWPRRWWTCWGRWSFIYFCKFRFHFLKSGEVLHMLISISSI